MQQDDVKMEKLLIYVSSAPSAAADSASEHLRRA